MPSDQDDGPAAAESAAPMAAEFDEAFSAVAASPGLRRMWELADPELPPEIEPGSSSATSPAAGFPRPIGNRSSRVVIWDQRTLSAASSSRR